MFTLVTIVHVICCLFLIGVVLLQQGKGADMGAVFGGSSSTIFGSSGAGNFLTRLTTAAAVIFMVTSLTLTYASTRRLSSTVFDTGSLPEPPPLSAPANPEAQPPAAQPQAQQPQSAAPQAEPQAAAPAPAPQAAAPEAQAPAPQAAAPAQPQAPAAQ
jgi:preprotein translocase subunit SecG